MSNLYKSVIQLIIYMEVVEWKVSNLSATSCQEYDTFWWDDDSVCTRL